MKVIYNIICGRNCLGFRGGLENMLVRDIMTKNVITASPNNTVLDALKIVKIHKIRHLPIVDGETLVGIVSDRDLRSVSPSILASMDIDILEKTLVKDIMIKDVITISPNESVEEAARLLYKHKIGCLPVIENDKLVGIVTDGDILYCFVEKYHIDADDVL
ncbi:MAG: Acetoin utilization protein AcuB [Clostridia bacterium 41_269]|nr:MAG: Acetoin utilization protein AcuB [Clostridia bacterium 41_269]